MKMPSNMKLLMVELAMAEGATAPPDAFRIFPAGMCRTTKGTFNFTEASQRSCMELQADYGNDRPVDYAHAMFDFFSPADPAEKNKAAGWFKPTVKDGELWASDVKWTPRAAKMLMDKEYRYTSAAFTHEEDGTITGLLNVALTNMPAMKGMDPLMLSQVDPQPQPEDSKMNKLIALLSLAATATESQVEASVAELLGVRRALLDATSAENASAALGVVQGWKNEAGKVPALTSRLGEIETASRKSEVKALLAQGQADGKVVPAQLDVLTKMGERSIDELKGFLSVAPVVVKTGEIKQAAGDPTAPLTSELSNVAKLMGNDPKKVAERVAANPLVPTKPVNQKETN